jgi:hypothetical protein
VPSVVLSFNEPVKYTETVVSNRGNGGDPLAGGKETLRSSVHATQQRSAQQPDDIDNNNNNAERRTVFFLVVSDNRDTELIRQHRAVWQVSKTNGFQIALTK